MTNELVFSRHASIQSEAGWTLLRVTIDESGVGYALMSDSPAEQLGHVPTRYRVCNLDQGTAVFESEPLRARLWSARPLGEDFLLAGTAPFGGFETGCVFDVAGSVRRTMDLGVGIKDVQVAGDEIWVSYFDEGVFSNRGEPGLACFDLTGARTFSFRQVATTGIESDQAPIDEEGIPDIADCYALNVVSPADVWLYYYTEFPLVHLRARRVEGCWRRTPVTGAHAVAVREPHVVFGGSYERPNAFVQYDLRTGAATELRAVNATGGQRASPPFARGRNLYVVEDQALWVAEV